MTRNDCEAAAEVLYILNYTKKEDVEKIPKEFLIKLINMAKKTNNQNLKNKNNIKDMNLKKRTIEILKYICEKYWN